VARYDPGISAIMKRTTYFLLLGLVPAWLGLLGLVWWSARRVVAPLETITREAQSLAPVHLGRRITIPPVADQETRLLASTLNNQLDQIEEAFEEMRRFTTDAAHELQTPLTVLLGHVDVALRRERSPEAYQEALKILHAEIEGLIRMVHSLLQLARLDRGEQNLLTEPLDLVSVIYNEAPYFIHQAEAKGVDFNLNLPDHAGIEGQPDLIQKIVINVFDNAVKFTEAGRINVEVEVSRQSGTVKLTVEDTGIGMSDVVCRHATDRFYRAPKADARRIPGSGLGLAIVHQIVIRHQGELKIESEPGRGTVVQVTMPSLNRNPTTEWVQHLSKAP
jgi:signal transduction histidine kinase